jgi:hypothetical protein
MASSAHITPEYLAEDRRYQTKIVYVVMACLITVVMMFRWYARIFAVKQFGLDDWLMTITWVRLPLLEPFAELFSVLFASSPGV